MVSHILPPHLGIRPEVYEYKNQISLEEINSNLLVFSNDIQNTQPTLLSLFVFTFLSFPLFYPYNIVMFSK